MNDKLTYCERQIALWYVRACEEEKNSKRKAAVNAALESVGDDFAGEQERSKLKKAMILNCVDRKSFPFYRLGIDYVSERDFYRRRDRFLSDILKGAEKK